MRVRSLLAAALLLAPLALSPDALCPEAARAADSEIEGQAELDALGVADGRASERLVRAVKALVRVRRQVGSTTQGELSHYRETIDQYAAFMKRDNLAEARERFGRAREAFDRLDRRWIDDLAARLRLLENRPQLSAEERAKLEENLRVSDEIATHLAALHGLGGERRRLELELDRTFRSLVRLGDDVRRIREEVAPLDPPPRVLSLCHELEASLGAEVRSLRSREEGLRSLYGRFEHRFADRGLEAQLKVMRATVGKVRAIHRVVERGEAIREDR
jgi:hypothetical protein